MGVVSIRGMQQALRPSSDGMKAPGSSPWAAVQATVRDDRKVAWTGDLGLGWVRCSVLGNRGRGGMRGGTDNKDEVGALTHLTAGHHPSAH